MGIPSFFAWLRRRYPTISRPYLNRTVGDASVCDHLYIDANALVHRRFWNGADAEAEGGPEKMFDRIVVDIVAMVRLVGPTSLVYVALDGVSPEAKLQQQRSRRYQAAKEAADRRRLWTDFSVDDQDGDRPSAESPTIAETDPNIITAGTAFMTRLSFALRKRFGALCGTEWRHLAILFSDAQVPGEGEHKIVQHIREQRQQPGYDPNTRHVVYGADADLIMLTLLTHEPHCQILREADSSILAPAAMAAISASGDVAYQLVDIGALRACLWDELEAASQLAAGKLVYSPSDLERAIADFVFVCLFCGNDFLPALLSISVESGDVAYVIGKYFECRVSNGGGFIVETGGKINLAFLLRFVTLLASEEDSRIRQCTKTWKSWTPGPFHRGGGRRGRGGWRGRGSSSARANTSAQSQSWEWQRRGAAGSVGQQVNRIVNSGALDVLVCHTANVRWGVGTWRDLYYSLKLDMHSGEMRAHVVHDMAHQYLRGLCWTMQYYYKGCACWRWAYRYHHPPLLTDLAEAVQLALESGSDSFQKFEDRPPYHPVLQLAAVLPPASAHAAPCMRPLLESPVAGPMFPRNWKIDVTGKRRKYLGTVLLPFVDLDLLERLLRSTEAGIEALAPVQAASISLLCSLSHPFAQACTGNLSYLVTRAQRTTWLARLPVPDTPRIASEQTAAEFASTLAEAGDTEEIEDTVSRSVTRDGDVNVDEPHILLSGAISGVTSKDSHIECTFTPPPFTSHNAVLLPGVVLPQRITQPRPKAREGFHGGNPQGYGKAVYRYFRYIVRKYVAAVSGPALLQATRIASLFESVARRVTDDQTPMRFLLLILKDFGKVRPKGQGTEDVTTFLLDMLQSEISETEEISEQRLADEVWGLWAADAEGLLATPAIYARLLTTLGHIGKTSSATLLGILRALLRRGLYFDFDRYAAEFSSQSNEEFPSPAAFAAALFSEKEWLGFLYTAHQFPSGPATEAAVHHALVALAGQLLLEASFLPATRKCVTALSGHGCWPPSNCASLVTGFVQSPAFQVARVLRTLEYLQVGSVVTLVPLIDCSKLQDAHLANLVALCQGCVPAEGASWN